MVTTKCGEHCNTIAAVRAHVVGGEDDFINAAIDGERHIREGVGRAQKLGIASMYPLPLLELTHLLPQFAKKLWVKISCKGRGEAALIDLDVDRGEGDSHHFAWHLALQAASLHLWL
jgi:hypothetical protein